jgi:hypothetical protein
MYKTFKIFHIMIIKKTKEVLSYILADKENLLLQNRLFLYSITFGILICLFGSIINFFVADSFTTVYIVALLVTCLLFIIYYFVRIKRISNHLFFHLLLFHSSESQWFGF